MRTGQAHLLARGLLACGLLVGCSDPALLPPLDAGAVRPRADAAHELPLVIHAIEPTHGSFLGGDRVRILGSGFYPGVAVRFGDVTLEPPQVQYDGPGALIVSTPGGAPGPVDVEVRVGGDAYLVEDGYRYDALAVDPALGPLGGGNTVRVLADGVRFADGDAAYFGDTACTHVALTGPSELECRPPSGQVGPIEVSVRRGAETLVRAPDAYRYVDTPFTRGGAGGGPIEGEVRVEVLGTGGGVEGATVAIGDQRALTDANGVARVAVSGGPIDVHVGHRCYGRTSFVGVDARDLFIPLRQSRVGDGCPEPAAAGGPRPRAPTGIVNGRLLFLSDDEFPVPQGSWAGIPPPRAGEVRLARVVGRKSTLFDRPDDEVRPYVELTDADYDPGAGGTPFRVSAFSGGGLIEAIAGLAWGPDRSEGRPYLYGRARVSVPVDREAAERVDLVLSSPISLRVPYEVEGPCAPDGSYRPRGSHFQLGTRDSRTGELGPIPARGAGLTQLTFSYQCNVGLLDWTMAWGATDYGAPIRARMFDAPTWQAPADGGWLARGQTLRWAHPEEGSMQLIEIHDVGGYGQPPWTLLVHPDRRSVTLPAADDVFAFGRAVYRATSTVERIEGFDFHSFALAERARRISTRDGLTHAARSTIEVEAR